MVVVTHEMAFARDGQTASSSWPMAVVGAGRRRRRFFGPDRGNERLRNFLARFERTAPSPTRRLRATEVTTLSHDALQPARGTRPTLPSRRRPIANYVPIVRTGR